eukprot:363614-Chlamydomonas_euryale.AAC.3
MAKTESTSPASCTLDTTWTAWQQLHLPPLARRASLIYVQDAPGLLSLMVSLLESIHAKQHRSCAGWSCFLDVAVWPVLAEAAGAFCQEILTLSMPRDVHGALRCHLHVGYNHRRSCTCRDAATLVRKLGVCTVGFRLPSSNRSTAAQGWLLSEFGIRFQV